MTMTEKSIGDDMAGKLLAPWSDEEVRNLNAWQLSGHVHPFTCLYRTDTPHDSDFGHDKGTLFATRNGWVCLDCNYTQEWAWEVLAVSHPPSPLFIPEEE